jgi:acyl-coenzyme A synthetase/AMP-(fatty) acid ligase
MTAQALTRGADYPAVEWEGRWIYWDAIGRTAETVRALVEASGADPRARVAMLPRSRPGPVAALLGLIAAGRNISMIHVYQSPEGVVRDVARLKPAVVVGAVDDLPEELVSALRGQGVAVIGLTGMEAAALPGCERSTAECSPPPPKQQIELLTSGTTGPPKPFPLTYDMIAEHMVGFNMMNTTGHTDPASIPPVFMYLAFNTISGLYLTLPTLLPGVRGVLVERFNLPAWRDYIVRFRPTSVGVPVPALQMVLEADIPPADLSSLRFINTGTAPLDPTVQRNFEEKYGIPVLLAYGATEFGGPVTLMTMEHHQQWGSQKAGSVGRPWAGAQLRVIDADSGAVLPPGQQGLLEVMTPRMGDHWIRTSDMAVIDEDGFVYHRGRADGAINRGGFKLLPDDIERALAAHAAVSAAAVTGIPDKRLGQVPAAVIQLKPGVAKPSVEELEAHLRKHVAATHIPATWKFVDTLPYNAMLKVDRVALRQMFETVEPN